MYYIPQIQKDDCGFACLKMVLAIINKDKNYLFIPQDESHGLYSLQDLMEIGTYHGVRFSAFRATNKRTVDKCPSFPFIAILNLKNGAKHAVTVLKVRRGRVIYLDPRSGKNNISLKVFVKTWSGTGLFIEDFEKRKCLLKDLSPVSLGKKILLGTIEFITGVLVILGVYFVNDATPIYMPIIFLSLAIVMELVEKSLSYSLMKKIDNYFFDEKKIPEKGFKDYLIRFEEYKKLSLSSPLNYVLALVFAIGLITVILLNDVRNFVVVVTPLLLSLIESFIVLPVLKKKKQVIGELEDNIDNSKNPADFKAKVDRMHRYAYKYSYLDLGTRCIFVVLMLVSVVVTMRLCDISSLPYIIFYTCLSFALFKTLKQVFSLPIRIEEFNIVKVRISNSMKSRE